MPKLNKASPILFETINNEIKHIDYDRCNEIAKDYTAYATGVGIEDYLKRFNQRETEEAFKQRKELTQVNTTDIISRLRKPLAKVNRTPATVSMTWEGKDVSYSIEKKKELLSVGSKFWGPKSVQKYLTQRISELDTIDPNSFLVIEFKEEVRQDDPKTKANPYPFEVNSKEAINYEFKNNLIQWLIVENKIKIVDDKGNPSDGSIYYMYIENETIKATQIHAETVDSTRAGNRNIIEINANSEIPLKPKVKYLYSTGKEEDSDKNKKWFILEVFEHKIGFVPAKRVGTTLDPVTRFRTCVPVIHPAKCYLDKAVKAMSEMDLTSVLHTFPQKIQYADPCDGQRVESGLIGCSKGLTPSGTVCKVCNGTGFKGHTSSQDVIQIKMPKEASEIVSLENIMVYKHPPIDLLKFQQEFCFDVLINESISAVYNSQIFSRKDIAQTATENNIDLDSVYDTLRDFADNSSELYVFCYRCIAAIRSIDKGLTVHHSFPSDFKMQPLDSLLNDLNKANENGAPAHAKAAINSKIIAKMYMDQPKKITEIETQDKFFPFAGKTESEIAFILASDLTTKFNKILYSHYKKIFNDLEFESSLKNIDFYEVDEAMQRALIMAKVQSIITEIESEDSADTSNLFNDNSGKLNPTGIEAESKAKLKGSIDGVKGILDIQTSFSEGKTTLDSAIAILSEIFGLQEDVAKKILGSPKIIKLPLKANA